MPALPTSYMEQPTPQGLWDTLKAQCLDGLPGCDVLAIPHNPNVSGGLMFAPVGADNSPLTAADAAFRVVDGAAGGDEPAQGRLGVPPRRR